MFEALALSLILGQGPIRDRLKELKPAPPAPEKTLTRATEVLADLEALPAKLPEGLIAKAEGVVIVPNAIKAGFVFGGQGGHGVALVRKADDTWGDPTFLNLGGASLGAQVGVQATDLVLVFKSKKSLERLLDGKGKLTLGVDAAVAAGPLGRRVEAATDGEMKAEVLSYSKSRGVFAGASIGGGVLTHSTEANKEFTKEPTKETLQAAENLKAKLLEMGGVKAAPKADKQPVLPPAVIPDAPPVKKDK